MCWGHVPLCFSIQSMRFSMFTLSARRHTDCCVGWNHYLLFSLLVGYHVIEQNELRISVRLSIKQKINTHIAKSGLPGFHDLLLCITDVNCPDKIQQAHQHGFKFPAMALTWSTMIEALLEVVHGNTASYPCNKQPEP